MCHIEHRTSNSLVCLLDPVIDSDLLGSWTDLNCFVNFLTMRVIFESQQEFIFMKLQEHVKQYVHLKIFLKNTDWLRKWVDIIMMKWWNVISQLSQLIFTWCLKYDENIVQWTEWYVHLHLHRIIHHC